MEPPLFLGAFYKFPVHINKSSKRVNMNSFANLGLSLHLAVSLSVTMPALLPPSAQPSSKEILQIWLKDNL